MAEPTTPTAPRPPRNLTERDLLAAVTRRRVFTDQHGVVWHRRSDHNYSGRVRVAADRLTWLRSHAQPGSDGVWTITDPEAVA